MNELLRPTLRALLGLVLLTAASAQSLLGPPRGTFGPGAGDALRGGPGDRGDVAPDGSGTGRAFVDPGSWQRWWAFNRDPYLLRIRVPGGDPLGPTALDGPPRAVTNPSRPADDVLAETVLPALLALLERHGRDNDVRGAVYLALGKIGLPPGPADDPLRVAVLSAVREGLEDRNEATREAAILALGVLGDARVGRDLVEVALGMKAGRKVLAGRGLDRRTRAIAAYAVASIGAATHREVERVFVAGQLERLLAAEPDDTDIGAAAVIGLGLTPAPFARTEPASAELPGRARAVSLLLDALEEGDELDVRALAQAPVAVARLVTARTAPSGAKSAAVEEARAALRVRGLQVLTRVARGEGRGRRKTAAIREGAAQGLGLLIDPVRAEAGSEAPDRAALEALFELARTGQEREAGLALLALARVAARGPAVADELTPWITGVARDGTGSARPWALVALGVLLGEVGAGHPARAPRHGARGVVRGRESTPQNT
ncbi:MAG: HEAT repeat domain-containing protein, partial [Planctomycetota bacterium]